MFQIIKNILLLLFIINSLQASSPCFDQLADISVPPTDSNFSTVSFVENSLYAKIPAFVALPQNIEDIQRCLKCAKANNIGVAIKAGGHSFASYSSIEAPGFMLSMDRMKNVTWSDAIISTVIYYFFEFYLCFYAKSEEIKGVNNYVSRLLSRFSSENVILIFLQIFSHFLNFFFFQN